MFPACCKAVLPAIVDFCAFFSLYLSVNELLKIKEDLTKERDEQLVEITKLRENLAEANSLQQKLEEDKHEADEKIMEVMSVIPFTKLN